MKNIAIIVAILSGVASTASASPTVGQVVMYKTQASPLRTSPALVTKIISGDTVNLVAVIDTADDWPVINVPSNNASWLYTSIAKGTGVGEWQEATIPTVLIDEMEAQAEAAVEAELGSVLALPSAPSSAGLTLGGAGVQLSATRPTRLNVRLTASMTSTLLGPQNYTVELRCDAGSTPTTVVDDASGALSGVVATTDQPAKLSTLVPIGHYCRVVTAAASANATLSLTASTKQVL